jgi:hypothetical protein
MWIDAQTGFVFDRWRKIVNAMIEKDSRSLLIRANTVIHLLEADLNLLWNHLGRRLMVRQKWGPLETSSGVLVDGARTQCSATGSHFV